jgi:hypothetical protein
LFALVHSFIPLLFSKTSFRFSRNQHIYTKSRNFIFRSSFSHWQVEKLFSRLPAVIGSPENYLLLALWSWAVWKFICYSLRVHGLSGNLFATRPVFTGCLEIHFATRSVFTGWSENHFATRSMDTGWSENYLQPAPQSESLFCHCFCN